MGRKIFITATDTGAGKTFVTANLIRLLLEQGISASAIKPVASGVSADGINEDVEALMQAQHGDHSSVYFFLPQFMCQSAFLLHHEPITRLLHLFLQW